MYVGLAIAFGIGVWVVAGHDYGTQFFAGWLTEYSLSVDNLFIFMIIMSRFAVPRELQQSALLVGIVLALVMRGIFIAVGAAAIETIQLGLLRLRGLPAVHGGEAGAWRQHRRRRVPREPPGDASSAAGCPRPPDWHGTHLLAHEHGKRVITPMFMVIVALGTTDLLFALDSIPAIYGLTEEPYLVLTANIFALMGLRQLYFLIGGLLKRLVYLSYGLAFLLGFIGVKLVLHAMHENDAAVHQRRRADQLGTGHPDLALARGHRAHPRRDHGGQPAEDPARRAPGGVTRPSRVRGIQLPPAVLLNVERDDVGRRRGIDADPGTGGQPPSGLVDRAGGRRCR